ncbi:MAG: isocitrate/isopropylmalate dehydrogenase family protein [Chloroflexi bacterium]|nr:isocitrate/isopropylmalate dehydrogenase family protein [Chloroflexota bacterium]
MQRYRIALVGGDHIGPEVVAEGRRVLAAFEREGVCRFEWQEYPWGAGHYLRTGAAMDADAIDRLRGCDAIYFGAHGDPARVPEHVTGQGMLHRFRKELGLFVNLRPARLLPGVASPLREPGDIDLQIVRENTEGEYSGMGGRLHVGTPLELGMQAIVVTRAGAERTIRFAFELARTRRRQLTCVTKGSALGQVMGVWVDVFAELAAEYPDVQSERVNVDAMAMYLLARPAAYDVIVASNLMGDILSDLTAGIVGGIGLAASANLDPTRRNPSLFEPIHGSAPDIAGQGIANPIAAIRAAALMLDWLGEREASQRIDAAIAEVLAEGTVRTRDLGGTAATTKMTDAVLDKLGTVDS